MKILFKYQYVPERAISVIRCEWYTLQFSHQQVLSFNQRVLELITILDGSLTITRENPLWEEYLIKLPEAMQNNISQQVRLMDILGNRNQMTLSGMMDIVAARTLPLLPMPSNLTNIRSGELNAVVNDEFNAVVDEKVQCHRCLGFGQIAHQCSTPNNHTAPVRPHGGGEGGHEAEREGEFQKQQSFNQPPPPQQSLYRTGQTSYRVNQPKLRAPPVGVTERPPTKEREVARLYLTNLNVVQKDINDKSDLLHFYAKVQTSHSKSHSAYTLMDPGTSHCYIATVFAKQLGLPFRHAGRMSIVTAGTKHPPEDRYRVWLNGRIQDVTGNYIDVTGWYTVFDLKGAYNIIIGKNWHSKTRHLVDSDNVLHLLDADWSLLTDG